MLAEAKARSVDASKRSELYSIASRCRWPSAHVGHEHREIELRDAGADDRRERRPDAKPEQYRDAALARGVLPAANITWKSGL